MIAVDTIRHTHRGPLVRSGDRRYSLRWTVLENDSDFGDAFFAMAMAEAGSVDEWLAASRDFVTPAQNGAVADRRGTIA
ncbi:MAG: hypothetical protein GWN71_29630, partial [Gammaproteobacteria bacterium]|nr:penicillin acylase family protein [Gemmatimonadota bacterium]NIU77567.1 hypothetical protein [Gammaproteobacteria bacterium]